MAIIKAKDAGSSEAILRWLYNCGWNASRVLDIGNKGAAVEAAMDGLKDLASRVTPDIKLVEDALREHCRHQRISRLCNGSPSAGADEPLQAFNRIISLFGSTARGSPGNGR